jgi:hypothetical protein
MRVLLAAMEAAKGRVDANLRRHVELLEMELLLDNQDLCCNQTKRAAPPRNPLSVSRIGRG